MEEILLSEEESMDSDSGSNGRTRAHAWIRSNILGFVAIFIALSGTAIAANVAGDHPGAHAAKKKKVKRGPAGPQGPQGIQGIQGAPGTSPVHAFAEINGGSAPNTVIDATASNITDANVVRQAAGLYCIYGLSFTPKVIQATPALYPSNLASGPSEVFTSTNTAAGDSGDCPNTPTVEQGEIYMDGDGNPGTFAGTDASIIVTIY
jgi:hypothetical protein